MMKLILAGVLLMISIIACNNQNHTNKNGEIAAESSAAREKILKDSIAKFPELLLLKEQLIQFYRDSADFDKAIATVDQALRTDSLNDRLWNIKAILHFENEDTVNSIRSFENALLINPSPRYLIFLGTLYAQTKDLRVHRIVEALLNSKQPETEKEAYFILGLFYNYSGDKINAISALDKCLSLDSRYMFAYREKGIALYDMGKYEDAVTVLDKAVTLQNSFEEGYYWLGRCLEKLNKPNDAIEEYKMALLYANNDYPEAKDALARLGVK
ncbi:MAG TPA: tetratricopeptide repeat protein [Ferruginibacter sp.]|nr:tetratricopeptide repeat protein [Ferruginibacter sp.]